MEKKLVIWDWNGTLYNDVMVCHSIINTMLCERKLDILRTVDDYRSVFCFPIPVYYKNAGLPIDEVGYESLAHRWIDLYNERKKYCVLNDKAKDVLGIIADNKDMSQIVLSATRRDILKTEIGSFGITHHFNEMLGTDDFYARSKIDIGINWMKEHDINPKDAVMIGDSAHDYDAARAMGCDCILVLCGHQNKNALKKCECDIVGDINNIFDIIKV